MATKDWKKVGKNRWRNNRAYIQIFPSKWKNKELRYVVGIGSLDKMNWISRKFLKTKTRALVYARSYMRKH